MRGYTYRVLGGEDVHDLTEWGQEPRPVGSAVECQVSVRAFSRRSGGVGWGLTIQTVQSG